MTPLKNAQNKHVNAPNSRHLLSGEPFPPGAEKPGGFFSLGGAGPGPQVRDEKPGGFFSTPQTAVPRNSGARRP